MLFLLLAIISSASVSIFMRLSGYKIKANLSMLAVNYLVCALLGAAYADFKIIAPSESGFLMTVGLGVLGGVLFLVSFILLQSNTRKNGVVLSSLFMKFGLLVPIVISVIFFRELPTPLQLLGFCISIGAIFLINYQKGEKRFGWGLIALLLLGGGAESMVKIYEHIGTPALSQQFLFYVFFSAMLLCTALILYRKERPGGWEMLFGALIGVPNFFSAKFLLRALETVPTVVAYPVSSVGTILVVTLAGLLLFKEKLKVKTLVGILFATLALIIMNF